MRNLNISVSSSTVAPTLPMTNRINSMTGKPFDIPFLLSSLERNRKMIAKLENIQLKRKLQKHELWYLPLGKYIIKHVQGILTECQVAF
jgi:hypothetical protein